MTALAATALNQRVSPDLLLVVPAVALLVIGLIFMTSASLPAEEHMGRATFSFLNRQLMAIVIGLLLAWVAWKTPIHWINSWASILFLLGVIGLVLAFVPGIGGGAVKGANRWVSIGPLNFQVSEAVKLLTIVYCASFLTRHKNLTEESWMGLLNPMILISIASAILILQRDFGSVVILLFVSLCMLFLGGVRKMPLAVLSGIVMASLSLLIYLQPYRVDRIKFFLDPESDPLGKGYQLLGSLLAIGRGGFSGVGIGSSMQKHQYLPEGHTDFIYSIICEEAGLIGALLVMALFSVLVGRAFALAMRAERQQQRLPAFLCYGIAIWLAFQVLLNMGVATGSLPTKGLTLPLISYGGSSMMMSIMTIGLLVNVSSVVRAGKGSSGDSTSAESEAR